MNLVYDSYGKLLAVQLPANEYRRLKKAAGESCDLPASAQQQEPTHLPTEPPEIKPTSVRRISPAEIKALQLKANEPAPKPIRAKPPKKKQFSVKRNGSTTEELIGRKPGEACAHYEHEIEGSWLGPPKKGQREATSTESEVGGSSPKTLKSSLPRTGSKADKTRQMKERVRAKKRNKKKRNK
jgi:hypothetical protein